MGFDGVVFTDDLTMGAVSNTYGMGEAAVLAVEAGCDVLLVCHGRDNLQAAYEALLDAVDSGRISQQRLNESVYRILTLKGEFDLNSAWVPAPDVDQLNAQLDELLAALGRRRILSLAAPSFAASVTSGEEGPHAEAGLVYRAASPGCVWRAAMFRSFFSLFWLFWPS